MTAIMVGATAAVGGCRLSMLRNRPRRARPLWCSTPRAQSAALKDKKCEPCEACDDAMEYMGMCGALNRPDAEALLQQVGPSWSLWEDPEGHLRLICNMRTRNFKKALELCNRIGDVAEGEGHHPDLHIESWNKLRVEVWTHARKGLTENDFILTSSAAHFAERAVDTQVTRELIDILFTVPQAAKIDDVDKMDLLSKKKTGSFADS